MLAGYYRPGTDTIRNLPIGEMSVHEIHCLDTSELIFNILLIILFIKKNLAFK